MPSQTTPNGVEVIAQVLEAAGVRPGSESSRDAKNGYAIRFADAFASAMARDLAQRMPGIQASPKRGAAAVRGPKQLDVNFSTPQLGLALGISLKSVHIREGGGAGRYTHNMKRNEEELRIEASGYHKRQPYAVMIGVLCLPFDSCEDAKAKQSSSSFGSWVRHLRPYTARHRPDDDADLFERLYVALYRPDGSDLRFFDIRAAPPRNGVPKLDGTLGGDGTIDDIPQRMLSYSEFLEAVYHVYLRRNALEFRWAEGDEEPIEPEEP
ncbi:MAG: hypothetical protein U1E89_15140 [Burkholderiaceae bacterium]